MAKPARPNFTQDVTNKVVALMEGEGLKPWEVSWDRGITKAFNPYTRERAAAVRSTGFTISALTPFVM